MSMVLAKSFTKTTPDGAHKTTLICECPLSGDDCVRKGEDGTSRCLSMDLEGGMQTLDWCPVMAITVQTTIPFTLRIGTLQEQAPIKVTSKKIKT